MSVAAVTDKIKVIISECLIQRARVEWIHTQKPLRRRFDSFMPPA